MVFRVVTYGRAAPPPSDTLLLVHHGIGEHAGRYTTWMHDLDLPMPAMGFDVRGHGHSAGVQGDANGLDQLVDDLHALIPRFLEASKTSRVLLYAHSMGGAVVARYLTSRTPHEAVAGVMFSAPAVAVQRTVDMAIKERLGRWAKRLLPELVIPSGLDPAGISSDPAQVQAYIDDPLVHDRVSLRLADSLLSEAPEAIDAAGRARVPAWILHGEDDPLIPLAGSRALAAGWGDSATLRTFAGGRHELHHERPELREQVRVAAREGLLALVDAS
jgi:alpha-beta hydrolase superfamily lysophospholipase